MGELGGPSRLGPLCPLTHCAGLIFALSRLPARRVQAVCWPLGPGGEGWGGCSSLLTPTQAEGRAQPHPHPGSLYPSLSWP